MIASLVPHLHSFLVCGEGGRSARGALKRRPQPPGRGVPGGPETGADVTPFWAPVVTPRPRAFFSVTRAPRFVRPAPPGSILCAGIYCYLGPWCECINIELYTKVDSPARLVLERWIGLTCRQGGAQIASDDELARHEGFLNQVSEWVLNLRRALYAGVQLLF